MPSRLIRDGIFVKIDGYIESISFRPQRSSSALDASTLTPGSEKALSILSATRFRSLVVLSSSWRRLSRLISSVIPRK